MIRKKFYSPAHVKNPTSLQHVVWLQPGQTLIVHLDLKNFPNPHIQITPPSFLKSLPCEGNDVEKQFILIQAEEIIHWGNYSSCFLGDVWIDSNSTKAKLVVMMASVNPLKSQFVTAVNPDCIDLRIRPFNIIEVVLYDQRFKEQDEWSWEWVPGKYDLEIEQIGYDSLNLFFWKQYHPNSLGENPNYTYALLPRANEEAHPLCRQHHFWFRFKESILSCLSLDSGQRFSGDLKFFGWADRYNKTVNSSAEYLISVYVDLFNKYRNDTLTTLSLFHRDNNSIPMPQIFRHPSFYCRPHNHITLHCPQQRSVKFELIKDAPFEDGCNTASAAPPRQETISHMNYYQDAFGNISSQHCCFDEQGLYEWWD